MCAAIALAVCPPARADDGEPTAADLAAARDLGTEGVLLAEAGKCKEAVAKLSRAAALYAAPTIVVPLGECQIKLGRVVKGTENLQKVVREPLDADAPKPFVEAKQHAQVVLAQALPRIAKLVIKVDAPASARVQVTIDGADVPGALLGAARPTDPGEHVIVASAPGFETAKQRIALADGESSSVALVLHARPMRSRTGDQASGSTRTTAGYITLGVGGVGIGVGAVLGLVAMQKKRDLDAACPGGRCGPGRAGELDSARNIGTASTIAFGVGLAAAAVGAWLVIGDDRGAPSGASARVWLGPGSAGVLGAF